MEELGSEPHDEAIKELNRSIQAYNAMVPNALLQKGIITKENIRAQWTKWDSHVLGLPRGGSFFDPFVVRSFLLPNLPTGQEEV